MIAGHPIDPIVATALCEQGVLKADVAAVKDIGPVKVGHVEVHWLGRQNADLWNFVQPAPASATPEEVAAALWGDPTKTTMAFAIRLKPSAPAIRTSTISLRCTRHCLAGHLPLLAPNREPLYWVGRAPQDKRRALADAIAERGPQYISRTIEPIVRHSNITDQARAELAARITWHTVFAQAVAAAATK